MSNGPANAAALNQRLSAVEKTLDEQLGKETGIVPRNIGAIFKRVLKAEQKADNVHNAIYVGVDGKESLVAEIVRVKTEQRVYAGLLMILVPAAVQVLKWLFSR